jgi:hypothetical protein
MQQYLPVLGVIGVVWLIILFIKIGAYLDKKVAKTEAVAVPKKVCPLHDWVYMEQPGMEVETYYLLCQRCGKTPSQVGSS